jgi:GDP-L-fucose synthase
MSAGFDLQAPIFVAGHRGLAGSAILRRLQAAGASRLLVRTRAEVDLRDRSAVEAFFAAERPAFVFLAAAKVGGILANAKYPVDFLLDNLRIELNVMEAAAAHGTRKLLFLGSSCIYPKLAPQPLQESHLLTGPLEPTNEAYAIAKIAGIKLADAYRAQHGLSFISAMPTNLYGPGDNFDLQGSHVLPALMRKCHEAKLAGAPTVTVWGSGSPLREFMHADDLADACVFLMEHYDAPGPINVGTGEELTVRELALLVAEVVGYRGELVFDASKPDGTPRKLMDSGRLQGMGWKATVGLREGLAATYEWYIERRVPSQPALRTQ